MGKHLKQGQVLNQLYIVDENKLIGIHELCFVYLHTKQTLFSLEVIVSRRTMYN